MRLMNGSWEIECRIDPILPAIRTTRTSSEAARRVISYEPTAHASYIASWIKLLKDHKREIFRAAADAQRIASMELGFHPDYAAQVQEELSTVPG